MCEGSTGRDVAYLIEKLETGTYPDTDVDRLLVVACESAHTIETRKAVVDGLSVLPNDRAAGALAAVARIDDETPADDVVRDYALAVLTEVYEEWDEDDEQRGGSAFHHRAK